MVKGMMLAAGRGTRLGPLTENRPKPLLQVANCPVMAQGIRCMRRLGISTIGVNVSYRAEQILEAFAGGEDGLTLQWLVEREASGTAGGMKGLQEHLDGARIVVIAGDAMLDVDLQQLLDAHRARGAFATLATIPVADPSLYGVVVTDDDGRIIRFQEKPAPGTEISHQANTGIYIFEPSIFDLIPADTFYDFAMNVFPEILRRQLPFFAMPVQGYWTDIGNPGDYLRANLDYLAGRIAMEGCGRRVGSSLIAESAGVDGSELQSCIIGDNVVLPRGCELSECVVWPETRLTAPCRLSSAILTPEGQYRIEGKEALPLMPSAAV